MWWHRPASQTGSTRRSLRFDVLDTSVTPNAFFADKGNQPLDNLPLGVGVKADPSDTLWRWDRQN